MLTRDLEKLLKEKWFLVAADFIAVVAVLSLGLDPHDPYEGFLAVLGILGASLIVVVPVMQDGDGRAERLAEQARLRTALKEEIDQLRDDFRTGVEAAARRAADAEAGARKGGEAAAAAVAQRASSEINALKSALEGLKGELTTLSQSLEDKRADDELNARIDSLAAAVRGVVADVEEVSSEFTLLKEKAPSSEDIVKDVRKELKKSASALAERIDDLAGRVEALAARAPSPAAPVPPQAEADPGLFEEEPGEEAPAPTAKAAEGQGTALTINLMIGIGNKPFVRGSGPGLSADKGVPMNFLGIGRWQWTCPQPDAAATVEVWKNDQTPLGEPVHLPGGEPVELDEGHFGGA
ncbi:MAG: hypothetical protein FJ410_01735 [Verrucomicrobia bacterium]|nr:hypothetical protein [Verrucomicrobiota bacterium]